MWDPDAGWLEFPFNQRDQLRRCDLQACGQLEDCGQGGLSQAALEKGDVVAMEIALEAQFLLGKAGLGPQPAQYPAEGPDQLRRRRHRARLSVARGIGLHTMV